MNLSSSITGGNNIRLIPKALLRAERSETKASATDKPDLGLTEKDKENKRLIESEIDPNQCHAHLDYLTISSTVQQEVLESFMGYVTDCNYTVATDTPWRIGGTFFHKNRFDGKFGISGGFTQDPETGLVNIMVRIPGKFWESRTVPGQKSFCLGLLSAYRARCHRFDVAVDDYSLKRIPLKEMRKAWVEGNHYHFREWEQRISGTRPDNEERTDYLGSRESDKVVRIYPHKFEDRENKSLLIAHRWETEYKGDLAHQNFVAFATSGGDLKTMLLADEMTSDDFDINSVLDEQDIELQQTLAAIAVGAVDFRDRSVRKDRKKASTAETERLPFFQEFIDAIGGWIKARRKTVDRSLEKTVNFFNRQVASSLSAIRQGLGRVGFLDFIDGLCREGDKRFSGHHKRLVRDIQSNPQLMMVRVT